MKNWYCKGGIIIMKVIETILLILLAIVILAVLLIGAVGAGFMALFGEISIWILRVVVIVVIGKLLYEFITEK